MSTTSSDCAQCVLVATANLGRNASRRRVVLSWGIAAPVMLAFVFADSLMCIARGQTLPTPVIDVPAIPADVSIPPGTTGNPIAFFDAYSWRAFIAVVWPALNGHRGDPDTAKSVGDTGPRVFETYKALYEVFHNDGSAPGPWNAFDPKVYNPCDVDLVFGEIALGSFSKFSDIGQAGFGTLVGPLVAQPAAHPSYIRYSTSYNRLLFDAIVDPGRPLYLRSNLGTAANPVTFPVGAVAIKAAWMDMTFAAHSERYYTRDAWVLDLGDGTPANPPTTKKLKVGLVGLHIVQKTASRPQWIWSTFEHVDNVPPAEPGAPGTFAFNDGTSTPMPASNPYTVSPLPLPTPAPFNVTRIKPIHTSTESTNIAYRAALTGTIWANYKLVMTQWPTTPNQPSLPGNPANTFPGAAPDNVTAFSNTVLETFEQTPITKGCMNCHNASRITADFVFSVADHAFPPVIPNLVLKDETFRELGKILEEQAP